MRDPSPRLRAIQEARALFQKRRQPGLALALVEEQELVELAALAEAELARLTQELAIANDDCTLQGELVDTLGKCKAERDEARRELDAANQRAQLLLDAKNYWLDRSAAAEAERETLREALEKLPRHSPACYLYPGGIPGTAFMERVVSGEWVNTKALASCLTPSTPKAP